jgi:hypothetical protein
MRHTGAVFDNVRRGIKEVAGRDLQLLRVDCAPSFVAVSKSEIARKMSVPPKHQR